MHFAWKSSAALISLVSAAACSQRQTGSGETVDALSPSTAPSTPAPTTPATTPGVTPSTPGTTAVTPPPPVTPTPSTPPATTSESTASNSVESSNPSEPISSEPPGPVCVEVTPDPVPCEDNLNTDEPQTPCSQWVEWGTCDEAWMSERHVCDRACGRCTGDFFPAEPPMTVCEPTATSSSSGSDVPPVMNEGPKLPPLDGGESGFTTRYWDCCKPHCGWPGNASNPVSSCDFNNGNMGGNHDAASGCGGGPAHMCWNFVPSTNGDNIAYAFAAHNGVGCGACFQFDFTGESHNPKPETGHDLGSQSLAGKSMIVQVINTGGIEQGQFDILVPGGGVGDFDACSSQWGTSDLGERYGGFFLACQKENNFEYEPSRQCARDWCDRVFSDKPDLHEGCTWFVEWFGLADNPTMKYKQVPCPQELTSVSGMSG